MTQKTDSTIIRAVTFPIAEPLSGSWKELRDALGGMWALTTQASNWIMTERYARDVRRESQEKMPKYEQPYLYPELRKQFPSLTPQSVVSIDRAVTAKYRALRYGIVWTHAVSLPSFRYPTPFPVHNQSWTCSFDGGNRPVVTFPTGSTLTGDLKRWEVRLRGGDRYRRQLAAFRGMADGKVKRGELAILKNHDGEILCKLVGKFERPSANAFTGVLRVRTDKDKLLIALDDKDGLIWNLNFDHLPRWISEYYEKLERLRQDRKAEQRPHPSFESRQDAFVAKQRRRMDSAVKEAAAQVCGFAHRRRFGIVRYDDAETGYAASFQWFALRERIKTKCEDLGLVFEHASGETAEKTPGPLAEA